MAIIRVLKHLLVPHWLLRRAFPRACLDAIEAAVAAAESRHCGELRFVVEGGLPLAALCSSQAPRARAQELFARLGIWDTEHNSGVLIYVQWLDRRVEIIADRGIAARVPQAEWDAVCGGMEQAFRSGDWLRGSVAAVERIGDLLARQFPAPLAHSNELSDRPLLL